MGQKWEDLQYQRLVDKHKSRDRGRQATRRENEGGQAWRMTMVGKEERAAVTRFRAGKFEGLSIRGTAHCDWCADNRGGEEHVLVECEATKRDRLAMLQNATTPLRAEWRTGRWSIQKEILLTVGANHGCEKQVAKYVKQVWKIVNKK
jgi:hypothetical protein